MAAANQVEYTLRFTGQTGICSLLFFFQAEDGIRDIGVTGVQTCALPIFGIVVALMPIFSDQAYPKQIGINATTIPLLIQNTQQSFARTMMQLIAAGRPLTDGDRKSVV